MNKASALSVLAKGKKWEIRGGVLNWFDESPQPTEKEINDKIAELQVEHDAQTYARNRRDNFPNEHDLIVALWEKVVEGRSESSDALELKRQQVKNAHQKPK